MRTWWKIAVRGVSILAVALLTASGAAGLDQMAIANTQNPTQVVVLLASGGQQSLHHSVMLGLAEGSLPGGWPFDDAPEERTEEDLQETLHVAAPVAGS